MIKTGWVNTSVALVGSANIHSTSDKRRHAILRRIIGHAFSEQALKSAEVFVIERINEWCQRLDPGKEGVWGQPRDMAVWSTLLTLDVLGELCFGSTFNAMQNQDLSVTKLLINNARFSHFVSYNFTIPTT